VEYSTELFDAEQAGLLTVEAVRGRLAESDALGSATFWTGQDGLSVSYGKGWAEAGLADPAPVWLTLPDGQVYQLTRQAAQQLGSTAKANKRYQEFIPPENLTSDVNFAIREGLPETELKLLLAGEGKGPDGAVVPLAVAQCRASVIPFSDARLLDIVLLTIRAKLGHAAADSAAIDYKFFNDREHTSFRVVVPVAQQVITGTGTEDAAWCYGIEVSNSATGAKQTVVSGYLFSLASTAGITDVERAAGGFQRRGSTPEAAYAWTAEAAGNVLDGLEDAFSGLQVLTGSEVTGDYQTVLEQLFRESPVSKDLKLRIVADLEDREGDLTMYDLADAAAVAANLGETTWREVRSLHDLAGHIVHQGGGMCRGQLERGCRRLLPVD
jgi:hypothetical protein